MRRSSWTLPDLQWWGRTPRRPARRLQERSKGVSPDPPTAGPPSDAGRRHSAPDYRHPGPSSSTCHPFPVEGGADDMTKVKAALVQCAWTGDKDSMIERHVKHIGDAAKQGAQVMCLQELFYGPYFCQVQDAKHYSYTEKIPDGPTTKLMQELARKHSMVLIAPMYEEDQVGVYYNTAAVIDADGKYLGKYRKTHIPHVNGFWEKFYFRPGNMGYPVFDTAVGKVGVYICYARHFPEGARMLGLHGASSSSFRPRPRAAYRCISGSSSRLRTRSPTATGSGRSTGWGRRRSSAQTTITARATSRTRAARSSRRRRTKMSSSSSRT